MVQRDWGDFGWWRATPASFRVARDPGAEARATFAAPVNAVPAETGQPVPQSFSSQIWISTSPMVTDALPVRNL